MQDKSVRQLSYAIEPSVKMEIFLSTLSNMLVMDTGSWGIEHLQVHNVTEQLKFSFYLVLVRLKNNLNLNSHIWLAATVSGCTGLEQFSD